MYFYCFLVVHHEYTVCASTVPLQFIQQFMNETSISRGDGAMTESTLSQLYALLSAVLALGGCVGALATHRLADLLGR